MIRPNDSATVESIHLRAVTHHTTAWLIRQGAAPRDAVTASTDLVTDIMRKSYLRDLLPTWSENSGLFCQHARWRWLDIVRREKSLREKERLGGEGEFGEPVDDGYRPEQQRLWPTGLADLLSDEQSEVLELHYVHGRTTGEIAGELGISERAVRGRLARAREVARDFYVSINHPRSRS